MKSDTALRSRALRPKDASTLILVRSDGASPRVLMGKRHEAHRFMPGKFVFPGGRVDAGDCRVQPAKPLKAKVSEKLMAEMRGRPSLARAQGMAMAAVRETFEEVGYIVGQQTAPAPTRSPAWQALHKHGFSADLSGLTLLARAITPPGRPRRFDTRFFVADAAVISNLDNPVVPETNELLEPHWITIDEARDLDLPWITGQILNRLEERLNSDAGLTRQYPCTFQYMRGKSWQYVTL